MNAVAEVTPRTAYIFPGQGSQAVGMGYGLFQESPAARNIFRQADEILGFPLSGLCFFGPDEELRNTINAQPAILATSIAAMEATDEARAKNPSPSNLPKFMAGHSLGEYTALVAAGALSLDDALILVRERGRLMQEAGEIREGGMAAILGVDEALAEQVCQQTGTEIANINCEGQIVISGEKDALVRAIDLSRALGARKVLPLAVSGAFHSSLMRPAVQGMAQALGRVTLRTPTIPVISNCTGDQLLDIPAVRRELMEQLYSCVQWSKSITYMTNNGVDTFVEIGPGKVLTGLVKRIARNVQTINIGDSDSVRRFAI